MTDAHLMRSRLNNIMATDITIKVNGVDIKAVEGERLLDVLQRNGIYVPTLCHHDNIKPYGVCRLCIVETVNGGSTKVVTSCNFKVSAGQVFNTETEKIKRERRMIMELILARSSRSPEMMALAERLGVKDTRFPKEDKGCILCGLCVKACEEVVGVSAIGFASRGPDRHVSSPFDLEAERCIGCGSCSFVCPTNFIKLEEKGHVRKLPLWHVEFKMQQCKKCGQDIAPEKQLKYIIDRVKLPKDFFDLCLNCRA